MQKYSKSVLLICPWMVCGVTSGAGLGLGWGSETLPSSAKYVKGTSSLYQVTNLINFLPSYQDNVLMWYVLKAIQKKIYDEHNIKMWDRGGVHSLLSQAPTWLSTALLTVGFANSSATEVLGEANFRPSHRVFTTSATQRSINHLLNPTPGTTLCMRIRSSYKEQRVQSSRTLKQKVSALTDEGRQAECAVVASWPLWAQSHSVLILHGHQYVVSTSCSEKLLLQGCGGSAGSSVSPYPLESVCQYPHDNLLKFEIALNLQIRLGRADVLVILSPSTNMEYLSIYLLLP